MVAFTRRAPPPGLGAAVSLPHALPLRDYDVHVSFTDAPDEVLKVQARCPLSAVRLASYVPEREWAPEKRAAISDVHVRRVR